MTLYRPTPLPQPVGAAPVDRRTRPGTAAARLIRGDTLVVADHHDTAQAIVEALVKALRPPAATANHPAKQRYRQAYRDAAWRLLVPVEGGRVDLPGSPHNGFLAELYTDQTRFWLPFPETRDLAHAFHRYDQGMPLAVLGHALHPFYGTYLPKRTEHLELFGTWLAGWDGPRARAMDVGTGSGVLAMMMARAGFTEVIATDINPNACESVRRDLARRTDPVPVTVREGDLLGGDTTPTDVIVFNPPWTEGPVENLLDRALHYEGDLFPRFFDQAHATMAPHGRVVLVFSNILRLVQPDVPHPVDVELQAGRFRLVDKLTRRVKPPKGSGRRTKERVEVWELGRP